MDLIQDLKPYMAHVDAYLNPKIRTVSDGKVKNELAKIWDKYKNLPEISIKRYGRITIEPPTDMTCDECKMKAIKRLTNLYKEVKNDVPKIAYKGVKSEVKEVKSSTPESTPATNEEMIAFYKTHLNAAGIAYHHKSGVKKLEELYNLLKNK
jgi:copper chaperone CopZ